MALLIKIGIVLTVSLVLLIIYTFIKLQLRKRKFRKMGLPYLGVQIWDVLKFFCGYVTLVELAKNMYETAVKCDAPIVVQSDFFGEMFVITDLDLIKKVLVKDFDHFVNGRTVATQQTNKYFKKMLFSMENEQWKIVRTKLSPSFSPGRIRQMYQIFQRSSENMRNYLSEQLKSSIQGGGKDLNLSQISSKFTMDVIASCIFGIDSKCWQVKPEEGSVFEKMGKQFTIKTDFKTMIKFIIMNVVPKVADLLRIDVMNAEAEGYFSGVVKDVVKMRRSTGEKRDDFLQWMLEAQSDLLKAAQESTKHSNGPDGSENPEVTLTDEKSNKTNILDDDDIIANAMLFLLAGFDNTLSVIIFSLYNLGIQIHVQKRLHQEVCQVLGRHRGQITYDAISEMTYLECVIHESMRLYPPSTRHERTCTRTYPVPGTNIVIEKGTLVAIPFWGIQHDARYFPEPHNFNPERFTPENKVKRHLYAYLPFGLGPRSCMATRFAMLQVKTLLAHMVRDFHFGSCKRTTIPMEFGREAIIKPKGGMWLNVKPRLVKNKPL